jgi:PAS domain-containing protein
MSVGAARDRVKADRHFRPFSAFLLFAERATLATGRQLYGSTGEGERILSSTASQPPATRWLTENGPKELELLFRAIIYRPSAPVLLPDNDRLYLEASVGASKFLSLPREKIIGRSLDDFVEPSFKPVILERWRSFLEEGEQYGTFRLLGPDGSPRDVEYSAKGNVLPVRHLLGAA